MLVTFNLYAWAEKGMLVYLLCFFSLLQDMRGPIIAASKVYC